MRPRVPPIDTPRLSLVSIGPEAMEALAGGDRERAGRILGCSLPAELAAGTAERFARRRRQLRARPSLQPWLLRLMVLRETGEAVGYCNFHGAPDRAGRAEMGYSVFESHRRRGFATEATAGLMDWAAARHGVSRFVLSISPGNAASLAVAAKLGFRQSGSRWDERDGEELVFELHRRC